MFIVCYQQVRKIDLLKLNWSFSGALSAYVSKSTVSLLNFEKARLPLSMKIGFTDKRSSLFENGETQHPLTWPDWVLPMNRRGGLDAHGALTQACTVTRTWHFEMVNQTEFQFHFMSPLCSQIITYRWLLPQSHTLKNTQACMTEAVDAEW